MADDGSSDVMVLKPHHGSTEVIEGVIQWARGSLIDEISDRTTQKLSERIDEIARNQINEAEVTAEATLTQVCIDMVVSLTSLQKFVSTHKNNKSVIILANFAKQVTSMLD